MAPRRNFLSQLIENDTRAHPRRQVRLDCTAIYLKRGLRGYMSQKATILNISEGGCLLTCPAPSRIDEHLYVVINGISAKFPCAVVGRSETNLNLNFNTEIPTTLVEQLAASRLRA